MAQPAKNTLSLLLDRMATILRVLFDSAKNTTYAVVGVDTDYDGNIVEVQPALHRHPGDSVHVAYFPEKERVAVSVGDHVYGFDVASQLEMAGILVNIWVHYVQGIPALLREVPTILRNLVKRVAAGEQHVEYIAGDVKLELTGKHTGRLSGAGMAVLPELHWKLALVTPTRGHEVSYWGDEITATPMLAKQADAFLRAVL